MSNSLQKPQLNEGQYKLLRHFVRAESIPEIEWNGIRRGLEAYGMKFSAAFRSIELYRFDLVYIPKANGAYGGVPFPQLYCFPTDLAKRLVAEYEDYKEALKDAGDE
jgi:hypothetical protein